MRVKIITAAFAAFVLTFSSVVYDFPAGCMHTSRDIASAEYSYNCITAELQGSGECSWAPDLQWSGYNLEGYNTYRVYPGDIIEVSVKIADPSGMGLNAISLRNEFGNLEFVRAEPDYESYLYSETKNIIQLLKSYAEAAMLNEKNLITYTFRVPLDAAPGEVFKVDWTDESDYEFALMNTERSRKNLPYKLIPAAFVAEYFAGEVTTTPVTTNVTKPVTTTVTTPAETKPASTSAAPVTTSVSVPAAEIRGDVDGNGSVNTIDLVSLTECIVSPENFSNKARYDVNSDGSVNAEDLLLLKKTFAAFMKGFAPSGPASSSTEPPVTTAPQYTAPPETTTAVTTTVPVSGKIRISAGNAKEVNPGDEVKVDIIAENTGNGFSAVQFAYDMEKTFTVTDAVSYLGRWTVGKNDRALQFLQKDGNNITSDGIFGEVYIRIPETAAPGRYEIKFTDFRGSVYDKAANRQIPLENDSFETVTAYIVVKERTPVTTTTVTTTVPVTTTKVTTTTTPQVTTTAVTTTENIPYMDAYNKIIEKHYDTFTDPNGYTYNENDIWMYWDTQFNTGDVMHKFLKTGYAFRDLNDDGIPELIFGEMNDTVNRTGCDLGVVYSYSKAEKRAVPVIESWYRSHETLLSDNSIVNNGVSGAASGGFTQYSFIKGTWNKKIIRDLHFDFGSFYSCPDGNYDNRILLTGYDYDKYNEELKNILKKSAVIKYTPLSHFK